MNPTRCATPEPGRARHAVDGAVGDQAAARAEHDELPEPRQDASPALSPNGEKRAEQRDLERQRDDRERREPGGDHHQLAVARAPAAQDERGEHVRDGERSSSQRKTASDSVPKIQFAAASNADARGERGDHAADRRVAPHGRVQRGAAQQQRGPHELAGRGRAEVGAEQVGQLEQRALQQQQPADEQHGLVRRRRGRPRAAPAGRARAPARPTSARIRTWTPFGSCSSSRSSSSAMPTVNTTAPAAMSGPRCAGGAAGRAARRGAPWRAAP